MASEYQETFDRIATKTGLLMQRYAAMLEANMLANRRIADLEKLLDDARKELQALRNENEYLKIASTIAPSREQIEDARAMVANLVRDIDRCITDLSD